MSKQTILIISLKMFNILLAMLGNLQLCQALLEDTHDSAAADGSDKAARIQSWGLDQPCCLCSPRSSGEKHRCSVS